MKIQAHATAVTSRIVRIDPALVSICHCTDCQALTGSAYRVTVPTLIADFERGPVAEDLYQDCRQRAKRVQAFCARCGRRSTLIRSTIRRRTG